MASYSALRVQRDLEDQGISDVEIGSGTLEVNISKDHNLGILIQPTNIATWVLEKPMFDEYGKIRPRVIANVPHREDQVDFFSVKDLVAEIKHLEQTLNP